MSEITAPKEVASLTRDAERLDELRRFLAINNNPGNRRRILEIDEELARINKRLTELA